MKKARSGTTASRALAAREADIEIRRLLADYLPEIARLMAQTRRKLRARVPHGFELLYDSYNGVGIGYGATQSYSSPVVSLLAYPRWVTLFFLYGAALEDPHRLLQGTGRRVRSIRVTSADVLDDPRVGALLEQALHSERTAFAAAPKLRTYVQSIASVRKPRASRVTSPSARKRARIGRKSG